MATQSVGERLEEAMRLGAEYRKVATHSGRRRRICLTYHLPHPHATDHRGQLLLADAAHLQQILGPPEPAVRAACAGR